MHQLSWMPHLSERRFSHTMPRTLARLLQARDHMQAAAREIHPARWSAIYSPQLAILEQHDILARFFRPRDHRGTAPQGHAAKLAATAMSKHLSLGYAPRGLCRRGTHSPACTEPGSSVIRRGSDRCWIFAPTSVASRRENPAKIRWDFQLSEDERFTDPVHARLLECLAPIGRRHGGLTRSPEDCRSGRGLRCCSTFIRLRLLLRWMHQEGFTRFLISMRRLTLTPSDMTSRAGAGRAARLGAPSTQELSMRLLVLTSMRYRKRGGRRTRDGTFVPASVLHARVRCAEVYTMGSLVPYTPDAIARAI